MNQLPYMIRAEGRKRGSACRAGFTLVEILVVVVLLGILAAVVIPSFSHVVKESRMSALVEQLRRIRTDIYQYKVHHDDAPPNLTGADWSDLLEAKPDAFGNMRGPYLNQMPKNPLNQRSNVLVVASNPNFGDPVADPDIGFVYNPNTGIVWGTNTAGDAVFNEGDLTDPNN